MACDQMRLAEYVAGALAPEALPAIEEHLSRCAKCRAEMESLRSLRLDMLDAETPLAPAEQARLCALTWSRIRRLSSGSRSRRVRVRRPGRSSAVLRRALAAAAILVVAGGFLVSIRTDPAWTASVAALEGDVAIDRGGAAFPASAGTVLEPGDIVRTGAAARAELAFADGTRVEMNERAGLALGSGSRFHSLTLDRGDVYVQAAKQEPARALVFNPGRYDVATVVGTAFEMTRSERQTTLRMAEGRVEFGAGKPVSVDALQASCVGPGEAPIAPESIALTEIGAWRRAAAAGVIYEDYFAGNRLASFWRRADPPAKVSAGSGHLVLHAGAAPGQAELISSPVRLGPKPTEFVITREKKDGSYIFLPWEGQPVLTAEFVDEAGEPACRLIWRTTRGNDGVVRGIFEVAMNREPAKNTLGMPTVSRVLIDEDGRIVVAKGESTVQAVGHLGRRVGAFSLRLRLVNSGPSDVKVRWKSMVVRRLEQWPEWAQSAGPGSVPGGEALP